MTITKRSTVNQIEITAEGAIQVRFAVDLVENGQVIDRKWHRTSVEPGGDVDAQIAAVNANLVEMGKEPVTDHQAVKDHAAVAFTREKVEAHRERVAASLDNPSDRAKYRAAVLKPTDLDKFPKRP